MLLLFDGNIYECEFMMHLKTKYYHYHRQEILLSFKAPQFIELSADIYIFLEFVKQLIQSNSST